MEDQPKPQPVKFTVRGQNITARKHDFAKQLRRKMTPAEAKLWARLKANRLEGIHFRRQQIIEPFIVDFYCHQAALIIEIDGDIHQYQQHADQRREAFLRSRGYRIIRFSNEQVMQEIQSVLETIYLQCTQ
jgi:very-short-patch-repair endonuclease